MKFRIDLAIAGVDYSTQLTGEVRVSINEGEARLAKFVLDPFPGPIDPQQWIGRQTIIHFVQANISHLLFTGMVHSADYDIDAGTTSFTCTDGLQEYFEKLPRGEAQLLISVGLWSGKIFGAVRDNWSYAQQKLSTYAGNMDFSPAGVLRFTGWRSSSVPDKIFTAKNIDSGTLKIDKLAERRSIINSVKITYSSLFQGLYQFENKITWDMPGSFDSWLADPFYLPEKRAIEDAFNSAATLKSITYSEVPASGEYTGILWLSTDAAQAFCTGFVGWAALRWRRDIVAEYTITVRCPYSIGHYDELQIEQKYSVSHKAGGKNDDWQKFDEYKPPEGDIVFTDGAFGDRIEYMRSTQGNDADPQACAVAIAKTKILASHRQNRVSFDCALDADLDVDKTVAIDHPKLVARGKLATVEHVIDLLEGAAVTHCVLAISWPYAPGQTTTPADRNNMPARTAPIDFAVTETLEFQDYHALPNHIGNTDGAAPEQQDWNGFVSNHETWIGIGALPALYKPVRFVITAPALDKTKYNAWYGDVQLPVTILSSNQLRVDISGESSIGAGGQIVVYDGENTLATITLTEAHIKQGYVEAAGASAVESRETSITYQIAKSFSVALPEDILEIRK